MAQVILTFFVAYGIVVGGSLSGGLGAFLTDKPPLLSRAKHANQKIRKTLAGRLQTRAWAFLCTGFRSMPGHHMVYPLISYREPRLNVSRRGNHEPVQRWKWDCVDPRTVYPAGHYRSRRLILPKGKAACTFGYRQLFYASEVACESNLR